MTYAASKSVSKTAQTGVRSVAQHARVPQRPAFAGGALERLHTLAGNRAVTGLAPPPGGVPMSPALRSEMEGRFGADFQPVRIHHDGAAAARLNARAYTHGEHIVFGAGRFEPHSLHGRRLIAHELAHVVQQRRGGAVPALDPQAAHEQGADRAADAYAGGAGSIGVDGATGVGVSRSVEDWLDGGHDVSQWGYSALLKERSELKEWQHRQIATDDNMLRIEEALGIIEARIATLEKGVHGPAPAPRKKARARKAGARKGAEAARENATAAPEMEPPRCLMEQGSIVFRDADEMRDEFDRIVSWLQRKDVSAADRRTLKMQLELLAPQLGEQLQQHAVERRRNVIGRALTPTGTADARTAIVDAVRLVDSIKPVTGSADAFYLMHGNEMITLTRDEAVAIRTATIAELQKAAKQVERINDDAFGRIEHQAAVDREQSFAAWGTSLFTDKTTWELLDEFLPIYQSAVDAYLAVNRAARSGDLMTMAQELANAEERAVKGSLLVSAHVDDIQTTGGKIITGLQITQAVAFTIVMIGTAGAAAPAIGTGLAGAGITGTAGTLLTAAGTAGVVGAEGFALHGGSAMGGQLAAGRSLDEAAAVGWKEGKKGFETGAKIGVSVVAAPLVAARFGATAQGLSTTSRVLRSGSAAGTTNLGVEAGARAVFHQELIGGGDAAAAFGGGLLGGATGPLTQKIVNPVLRGSVNVGAGAVSSGAVTYAQTGDVDRALQSAAVGGSTALAMGKAPQPSRKTLDRAYATGQRVRGGVLAAKNSAANTLRAAALSLELSRRVPQAAGTGSADPVALGRPSTAAPAARTLGASAGTPPTAKPAQPARDSSVGTLEARLAALQVPASRRAAFTKAAAHLRKLATKDPRAAERLLEGLEDRFGARTRSDEVAEQFAQAQRQVFTDKGPAGKHRQSTAADDRAALEQCTPGGKDVLKARVRESERLGDAGGRTQAAAEGIALRDWNTPQQWKGEFGKGPDALGQRGVKRQILEFKGGSSRLGRSRGVVEMSNEWAGRKIAELEAVGDKAVAAELLAAARNGDLQGVVYRTRDLKAGETTTRLRGHQLRDHLSGERITEAGLIEYSPTKVERAYRQRLAELQQSIEAGDLRGLRNL